MDELNKRLLEFAEVRHEFVDTNDRWGNKVCRWCGYITPFAGWLAEEPCEPDFPHDLNAIEKWLFPRVLGKYAINILASDGWWEVQIFDKVNEYFESNEKLPLALCLAVDKLIKEAQSG